MKDAFYTIILVLKIMSWAAIWYITHSNDTWWDTSVHNLCYTCMGMSLCMHQNVLGDAMSPQRTDQGGRHWQPAWVPRHSVSPNCAEYRLQGEGNIQEIIQTTRKSNRQQETQFCIYSRGVDNVKKQNQIHGELFLNLGGSWKGSEKSVLRFP